MMKHNYNILKWDSKVSEWTEVESKKSKKSEKSEKRNERGWCPEYAQRLSKMGR